MGQAGYTGQTGYTGPSYSTYSPSSSEVGSYSSYSGSGMGSQTRSYTTGSYGSGSRLSADVSPPRSGPAKPHRLSTITERTENPSRPTSFQPSAGNQNSRLSAGTNRRSTHSSHLRSATEPAERVASPVNVPKRTGELITLFEEKTSDRPTLHARWLSSHHSDNDLYSLIGTQQYADQGPMEVEAEPLKQSPTLSFKPESSPSDSLTSLDEESSYVSSSLSSYLGPPSPQDVPSVPSIPVSDESTESSLSKTSEGSLSPLSMPTPLSEGPPTTLSRGSVVRPSTAVSW